MNQAFLGPGIYLNLFPVDIPIEPVKLMIAERSQFTDLRPLREEIQEAGVELNVYGAGHKVYGYGQDCAWLKAKGFKDEQISLHDTHPQLVAHCIGEGFLDALRPSGYEPLPRKARWEVFEWSEFIPILDGKVRVHKGFDLRAIWWHDVHRMFGLIIDVSWAFRDERNQPLNSYLIRQRYGYATLIEVGQIQGEYLPDRRINTEVSRQRLQEHILPFIQEHSKFDLPCGGKAVVQGEPVRVIVGRETSNE